jgi:hypothetical protein
MLNAPIVMLPKYQIHTVYAVKMGNSVDRAVRSYIKPQQMIHIYPN